MVVLDIDETMVYVSSTWLAHAPFDSFRLQGEVYHIYENLGGSQVFAVVVLHLKAGGFDYEAFRKEQLNSALELIKKHFSGIPCILCGDFNSNSMTYLLIRVAIRCGL